MLFLPAATNETFGESLTEALGTTLEHAHGGAPTLVTTSGLVGAQFAYLLSALVEEYELGVPIRVVGQVAKLYERLDYDCPRVEQISHFTDPRTCLDPGVITIAGPDVPRERSSGRLFGILRDNPNACVVQLVGSGETPMTEGRCTIHGYELVNHPSRQTLERFTIASIRKRRLSFTLTTVQARSSTTSTASFGGLEIRTNIPCTMDIGGRFPRGYTVELSHLAEIKISSNSLVPTSSTRSRYRRSTGTKNSISKRRELTIRKSQRYCITEQMRQRV